MECGITYSGGVLVPGAASRWIAAIDLRLVAVLLNLIVVAAGIGAGAIITASITCCMSGNGECGRKNGRDSDVFLHFSLPESANRRAGAHKRHYTVNLAFWHPIFMGFLLVAF